LSKTKEENTVNKNELISAVRSKTGGYRDQVEASVNAVLDTITATVASGETVNIVGFGSFSAKNRAARTGHNPATGEEISIPAARVPVFKAGKGFKDAVNNK